MYAMSDKTLLKVTDRYIAIYKRTKCNNTDFIMLWK